jgi:hypothetical protein
MNQRQQIINEFTQLKNQLNRSNKFKNQSTTLEFVIRVSANSQRELFGKIDKCQQFQICQEFGPGLWESFIVYEFPRFSQYLLNTLKDFDQINKTERILFDSFFYSEFNKLLGFK